MTIVAPHIRKPFSADALFRLVHSGFASLPDHRLDDTEITVSDALMSAFAMFSLQAPSLLAFDKARAEGNLHTIYGIARVPGDMHMREILAHDAGVLGGPDPAAVLRRVPGGVGEAGQQAHALGAHESPVL